MLRRLRVGRRSFFINANQSSHPLNCNSVEYLCDLLTRTSSQGIYFRGSMTIYPAIDLKGGRCVRLFQGKSDQETVYFNNPIDAAREWRNLGATHLHLVDLDGAFSGGSENLNAVASILSIGGMKVQLGGGMRNEKAISDALDLGLSRIIVGTSACENPSGSGINQKIWARSHRCWNRCKRWFGCYQGMGGNQQLIST